MKPRRTDLIAVLAAGTFAGAQLMIGISFAAQWRAMNDTDLLAHFAGDWINIATTIIPFALLQTIVLPLSLYFAWKNNSARQAWVISLVTWLINCTITAAYHFPVVWGAMQGEYAASQMHTVVAQWVAVHWIRIALGYATFHFAVLATLRANPPQPTN